MWVLALGVKAHARLHWVTKWRGRGGGGLQKIIATLRAVLIWVMKCMTTVLALEHYSIFLAELFRIYAKRE